jgi:hypothetical protein
MQIIVTHDFFIAGEVQPAGSVLEVDQRLGVELIHANRAEKYTPPAQPLPDETKPPKAKKELSE